MIQPESDIRDALQDLADACKGSDLRVALPEQIEEMIKLMRKRGLHASFAGDEPLSVDRAEMLLINLRSDLIFRT